MYNNLLKYIEKIRNILYFGISIKNQFYTVIGKYFPFNYIFKWVDMRNEYNKYETAIFIKNMPNWYKILEYNKIFIIIRVFSLINIGLLLPTTQARIKDIWSAFFVFNLNNYVSNDTIYIISMCFLLYLLFYISLRFVLGFIFFKKIVYNSPLNSKKAINWTLQRSGQVVGIIGLFFGVGTLTTDAHMTQKGLKPLFQGKIDYGFYYSSDMITKKMGSKPYDDYEYFDEEAYMGAGKYVKKMQENDEKYYQELHERRKLREEAVRIRAASRDVPSSFENKE